MKRELLKLLRSPCCGGKLALTAEKTQNNEISQGELACESCQKAFPIRNSIPRFVPAENYADNFGLQWNHFRLTQLDSHSGHPITHDRFYAQSGWSKDELRDRWVLDIGCGAGRFAEIAVASGANVVAVDYSSAADACLANLRGHERLHVIQGSVYELPFAPQQFDYVYCFGVLQHTPDVKRSLQELPRQLRPGGKLAIDVYPKLRRNLIWPKYWLRPITRRIPPKTLFALTKGAVPVLLPLSKMLGRIPGVGRQLRYAVPVLNYEGVFPLSPQQVREWAILDTYDMFSAVHDHPQTAATIQAWLEETDVADIEVFRAGPVVARACKPKASAAVPVSRKLRLAS